MIPINGAIRSYEYNVANAVDIKFIEFDFIIQDWKISATVVSELNASLIPPGQIDKSVYNLNTEKMHWEKARVKENVVVIPGVSSVPYSGDKLTIQINFNYYPNKGFLISELLFLFTSTKEKSNFDL
ncbi:hypothetical protein RF11_12487 [Thelohanellus kitauei]|uniref:Uncharacterized protein n=1 Tax=Thelohanellus kitauei TaxID=669202 RepID=A0A0C2M4Z7_THEKT|nr:hypothetical protein RF11_12487 [Thelohanellus kitauei]